MTYSTINPIQALNAESGNQEQLLKGQRQMTTLHAQPYNIDATGFYFENADDFITKMETLTDSYGQPVEEFEIQFIDGDDAQLFNAIGINQATLSVWFDEVEPLEYYEKVSLYYLVAQLGYSVADALDQVSEPNISQERMEQAAEQLFDEIYLSEIPAYLHSYIDYKQFAYDLKIGGDLCEFEYNGETYTCLNANGF